MPKRKEPVKRDVHSLFRSPGLISLIRLLNLLEMRLLQLVTHGKLERQMVQRLKCVCSCFHTQQHAELYQVELHGIPIQSKMYQNIYNI